MKDDLISREAAIEAVKIPTEEYSHLDRNGIIIARVEARRRIRAIPSVEAVPLAPLCEWLADKAYMYLSEEELDNGWSSHDPAYWEMKLSKWMEEQNATD